MRVVRGSDRHAFRDDRAERRELAACGARDGIVATLEAERRPARSRDLRAARAAAAVRREDRHIVSEREDAFAHRVVRRACEALLDLGSKKIDARDLADEKRSAGEE